MSRHAWAVALGLHLGALCAVDTALAQALPVTPAAASDAPPAIEVPPSAAEPRGPIIEMPPPAAPDPTRAQLGPDDPTTAETTAEQADQGWLRLGVASNDETLIRGLQPARMAQPRTVIGGYGQFTLNAVKPGDADEFKATASVRRLVLFVAHPITDDIRVYTEFEWENTVACAACQGAVEIEQAFVDARLLGDALSLRAGLVLIPMGIVNQWHEPPVFHGVERPAFDTVIIPTTWRELGAGFTGQIAEVLRYELYLTTTLNPLRLSETGLASARTQGSFAPANGYAVSGRAELEPVLGMIAGASFFFSNMGGNADYYRQDGRERDLKLPVFGYSLDARVRRAGFEARAVWAQFFLPNSDDLVVAYRADGSPYFPREATEGTLPTRLEGGYVELAYDVLSLLHVSHELLAFARLETYDTQAAVPKGYKRNPALDIDELTLGMTYRPVTQLVFKGDLQLRDRRYGYDVLQWNLGFGYMF